MTPRRYLRRYRRWSSSHAEGLNFLRCSISEPLYYIICFQPLCRMCAVFDFRKSRPFLFSNFVLGSSSVFGTCPDGQVDPYPPREEKSTLVHLRFRAWQSGRATQRVVRCPLRPARHPNSPRQQRPYKNLGPISHCIGFRSKAPLTPAFPRPNLKSTRTWEQS